MYEMSIKNYKHGDGFETLKLYPTNLTWNLY
jgi:hypothetical protein